MTSGISSQDGINRFSPPSFDGSVPGDFSSPSGPTQLTHSPPLDISSKRVSTCVSKPIPRPLFAKSNQEIRMNRILQQAGIKSKISFGENLVVDVREFEITNSRYWSMFPICCPHYPDVRCFQELDSLKKAHDFLDSLYRDPCVSKFIPQGSVTEILGAKSNEELESKLTALYKYESSGKILGDVSQEEAEGLLEELRKDVYNTLGTLYETVKLADRSERLNTLCREYLYSIKDTPDFYEAAAVLLDNLDFTESDEEIFLQEYEKAEKGKDLDNFVYNLSKLIPLDIFARLRLDADLLSIVENQPNYTRENAPIEEVREIAKIITELDLSEVPLRVVPPELSKVVKCNLGNNYQNILDDVFIQLPKLAYLTLCFDQTDEEFEEDLLRSMELMQNLQELDLSASPVELEEIPNIIAYALENGISILLPVPEKERDLIALMYDLGLQLPEMPPNSQNRYFTGTQESLNELKELNAKCYQDLLTSINTPGNTKILSGLKELDLTNLSIGTLSEELLTSTGIESVIFDEINESAFKIMVMMSKVIALPTLKTLIFSDRKIEELFPNLRSICEANEVELITD